MKDGEGLCGQPRSVPRGSCGEKMQGFTPALGFFGVDRGARIPPINFVPPAAVSGGEDRIKRTAGSTEPARPLVSKPEDKQNWSGS